MNKLDLLLQEIRKEKLSEKDQLILMETAWECYERQALIEKTKAVGEVNISELSRILETATQKLVELNKSLQTVLKSMQGLVTEVTSDLPKTIH